MQEDSFSKQERTKNETTLPYKCRSEFYIRAELVCWLKENWGGGLYPLFNNSFSLQFAKVWSPLTMYYFWNGLKHVVEVPGIGVTIEAIKENNI